MWCSLCDVHAILGNDNKLKRKKNRNELKKFKKILNNGGKGSAEAASPVMLLRPLFSSLVYQEGISGIKKNNSN